MSKLTLTELINKIIQNSYLQEDVDEICQSSFSAEGARKVNYIIDDLKYKESRYYLKLGKFFYLSIGGADGSEAEKILIDTGIRKAIIIEISEKGAQLARERAKFLLDNYGKELIVIQGDAFDKLEDCLRIIRHNALINQIDGLIVSAQAVLHELPRRSKNYDSAIFLGKLYQEPTLRHCLFYSREPCSPKEWTERVRIRIETVNNTDLYRLACHVRDRLQITGSPQILSSNWLDLETVLAIETLHKLLRNETIERIEYELGEQLTELDPLSIKRNLESCVEGMKVSLEYITTLGFKRALIENNVEYLGHNSELLPFPKTHVEIIGFKTTKYTTHNVYGDLIIISHNEDADLTQTKEVVQVKRNMSFNFTNPFNGDISNEEILAFLEQFEDDEIPVISKLVANFTYIGYKKIEEYCKVLFAQIQEYYKENYENIVFIPFGRASKSGGIIAYFFRTINKIPESKFLSSDSEHISKIKGKIFVFIDDLIASGHHALQELAYLQNNNSNQICLAVLVSCEQGIELLQEKLNINILTAFQINRKDSPLNLDNHLFNLIEKKTIEKIIRKYSYHINNFNPFGYAGLSLLLAFFYNTPDNTLPIFWSPYCMKRPLLMRDNLGREDSIIIKR